MMIPVAASKMPRRAPRIADEVIAPVDNGSAGPAMTGNYELRRAGARGR
jgi:hypothetical protein